MAKKTKDSNQTLEKQAMQTLLEWLAHGQAKPGQALPLREFSSKFGMSRTPLRAAAGRLHEQGLLDYDSRYGFTVAIPTKEDLTEFFDMREMVETYGARSVIAKRIVIPHELESIIGELKELAPKIVEEPGLHNRFWRLDVRFHRALLSLAGNSRLLELWDQLLVNIRVYQFGRSMPLSTVRFQTTAEEHEGILQAYKSFDADLVVDLLSAHIRRIREQTIAIAIETLESSDEPDWLSRIAPSAAQREL
ncbi:MAG: GntR family transcriptional regulator [Trueperaceae bacterium]|nr:GntR family transcriptional regulator [Trueperaceae bacterium]